MDSALARFGRIDTLVNNAGVSQGGNVYYFCDHGRNWHPATQEALS